MITAATLIADPGHEVGKTQTVELAKRLALGNPGIRVAVASTGSGIAIFNEGKWQAVIERTLFGT